MKTNNTSRDALLCQDYKDGIEINELARSYGLSERRIAQILNNNAVPLRPRSRNSRKPLSRRHVRLGLHLRTYRLKRNVEASDAAIELGWSAIKLRKIEKGLSELELLDLLDISTYTKTAIEELIGH